jgi:hypothetical protein
MRVIRGVILVGCVGFVSLANRMARADPPNASSPLPPSDTPATAAPASSSPSPAPSSPPATTAISPAAEPSHPPQKNTDISSVSLGSLLQTDVNVSTFGSAAYRLPKQGYSIYIHGTANLGAVAQDKADPTGLREVGGDPWTFVRMAFNFFAGASINDVVFVESEMKAAPVGDPDDPMSIRYAQVDVRIAGDYLLARVGEFFVPMGGLNVYPDPDYLHKFPDTPLLYRHVVPQDWSEVGFQLYGRVPLGSLYGSYALYAVNGLEQRVEVGSAGTPAAGSTEGGGALFDLAFNHLDLNSRAKSLGGRIGLDSEDGLGIGISGYTGPYTIDGRESLHIGDVDLSARFGQLSLKAEGALTIQEIAGGHLTKKGFYALASYRVCPEFEPMLRLDGITIGGTPAYDRTQLGIGAIVVPYPEKASTLMLKAAYYAAWDGDGNFATNRVSALLAVAF